VTTAAVKIDLKACLDQLEQDIDLDWERRKISDWKRFLDFEPFEGGFRYRQPGEAERQPGEWPEFTTNEAIREAEAMLLHQLGAVYRVVCRRSHEVPNIRCNYGTGILSSLFGAEVFWMPDEMDTLPTTKAFESGDALSRLLAAGEPDLESGWGGQVFETGEYFKQQLAPYPKMSAAVWLYHPDLQGPMDIAELLLGGELLLAFYDRPDDVKAFMEMLTSTYIRFMKKWFELVPPRENGAYMAHWGKFFKGGVMLREDSLVNLSPDMYTEFVRPFDQRILDEFGGGAIHFCGKCDHVIEAMTEQPGLSAVNPSQPELNDVRELYAATIARGIVLDTPAKITELLDADFSRGALLH
jgi:hypothetical protein